MKTQKQLEGVGRTVMRKKWRWAGHVARNRDERQIKAGVKCYPCEEIKKRVGRSESETMK